MGIAGVLDLLNDFCEQITAIDRLRVKTLSFPILNLLHIFSIQTQFTPLTFCCVLWWEHLGEHY